MMDTAKRALAVQALLESNGYEIVLSKAYGSEYALGFVGEVNGTQYPVSAFFSGNAVSIRVIIVSFDIDDFSSQDEAARSIPLLKTVWMNCAAIANAKMDGLCFIVADMDDAPSLSIDGMVKGYYLNDEGADEYFFDLLQQSLTQTDAGAALTKNLVAQTFAQAGD